jgi:hypothetical protein
MRDRTLRKQVVTVRPLNAQQGDSFGDAPILTSQTRLSGFRLKIQVSHTFGVSFEASKGPGGTTSDVRIVGLIRKRDVPPNAPDGWSPTKNDLFELADGYKLFMSTVEPAYPRRISIGSPNGGFDGWRVVFTDQNPSMSPASEYE